MALGEHANPSMAINFDKGVWFCFSQCGGGTIERLFDCYPEGWVPKDEHLAFAGRR